MAEAAPARIRDRAIIFFILFYFILFYFILFYFINKYEWNKFIYLYLYYFSANSSVVRIRRCQRCGPSSILGWRNLFYFILFYFIFLPAFFIFLFIFYYLFN